MTVFAALLFHPLIVETDRHGRLRTISGVHDAAELLVGDDWPAGKRGSVWRGACEATYQPLSGKGDVEAARQAFIFAATAAGIFVREGDGGDDHRAVG